METEFSQKREIKEWINKYFLKDNFEGLEKSIGKKKKTCYIEDDYGKKQLAILVISHVTHYTEQSVHHII